jgi:hypothetical protein
VLPNAYHGTFVRGTISSWNASVQQLLPFRQSLTLGYVANRLGRQYDEREWRLGLRLAF